MSNAQNKGELLLSDLYMDYKKSDIANGLTEEEIRKNVTDIYTKVNKSFESSFKDIGNNRSRFSVNDFLDGVIGKMRHSMNTPRKYTAESINKIMEFPYNYKDDLIRMSTYFYLRSQEYKGIISYKSDMLTYSNVMYPVGSVDDNFDVDDYMRKLEFVKDYHIQSKFSQATKSLVKTDLYFAYELSDNGGKNYIWKKLPVEFCTILGKDRFETYRVGFDMSYFDKYPSDLNSYPKEFKDKYELYKLRKDSFADKYKSQSSKNRSRNINADYEMQTVYELDNSKAIAFKFDESVDYVVPYYSGMFVDLVRLSELKDVDVINTVSDNYKLIHQQVPMNKESGQEDDYLISGDFLSKFHDSLVKNAPAGVGVATTPMPLTAVTLKNGIGSAEESITSKQVSNILTQSGTSNLLFNGSSTSALGLNKNIQVDENMMFGVLKQYQLFMRKRLYQLCKNSYKYELRFLENSHFNTEDLIDRYMKTGSAGFNTEFEVNALLGRDQIDFINSGKILDKLNMRDSMIPFKSSHVGDATSVETGGKVKTSDLTDDGAESRERDL